MSVIDRWNRERKERQRESDHSYEVSRLERNIRDQEARTRLAYQKAENYRIGIAHAAQREYEEWQEDIAYVEGERDELAQRLEVVRTFSAQWKALAKKQRQDLAAANARIGELEAGNAEGYRLWLVVNTPDELAQKSEPEMFREADEAPDGFTQLFHLGKWYYGRAFTVGVYGRKEAGGQNANM